ncbi:GntR family transcriptional regulator [Streptococcus pseudoporcinus]|uniref:GntR family transcriptional regulator n=1 Tax=Streptococcus pseudoporcinus TaxID=361101 RepID=A0A4U9XJE1_9STRE|nr:GntR family transcriptional regulator [Streptococcus pseudoporcinus]VTS13370.1 GntR family transcriptional regulator [Streptococcus pseudoporcinus]VUC66551.1 GntR family transcriptional regulator [Streptococcus pseudoporcinus]VUC97480.1 GntR family transcriptional regulator [Streptococcus pseudoporcinus]VUC97871.1 GntR family transcriptional regulator [Streptococcus pseudoporcinus]
MQAKKPKYQVIKENLYHLIMSKHYKKGDLFFTEAELIQKYKASSITIKRALKELENDGFISRKQGLGTFIKKTSKDKVVHFSYTNNTSNHQEDVFILSLEKGNDPYYLSLLGLHKTEHYYTLSRQRWIDNEPYLFQKSFIPHDYIANPKADLSSYTSVYQRFFEDFNIQMAEQDFSQKTDLTLDYSHEVAEFLQLDKKQPCVRQLKLTKDKVSHRILEYAEVYKNWKFFQYRINSLHYDWD